MATLSGQSIDTTYPGLIKTTDNAAITGTLKALEDGSGNTLPIEVSSTTVNFTGTVTGIPAAGLVAGSGANSMESSGDLTDLDADASGTAAIALGRNSLASNEGAIGLGNYGRASNAKAIAIGQETTATGNSSIAMGWNSTASATGAVALGSGVTASTDNTVSVKALQTQTASTPTAGGIIMTDAGSTQKRINITSGGILQVDAEPVVGNHQLYQWEASVSGYGATYAKSSRALISGPFWQAAVDQNANTIILSQMFVEPGVEITSIIPAFLSVASNDTYEIAMYDTYADGSPKDKVFTTSVSVVGASGDQYVEQTVSWTPTKNSYWIAIQTGNAGNSKIGMMPRDNFSNTYFTYGAWGASPVGLLSVNSLYTTPGSTGLPSNFAAGFGFGHRDEGVVVLYKTA